MPRFKILSLGACAKVSVEYVRSDPKYLDHAVEGIIHDLARVLLRDKVIDVRVIESAATRTQEVRATLMVAVTPDTPTTIDNSGHVVDCHDNKNAALAREVLDDLGPCRVNNTYVYTRECRCLVCRYAFASGFVPVTTDTILSTQPATPTTWTVPPFERTHNQYCEDFFKHIIQKIKDT